MSVLDNSNDSEDERNFRTIDQPGPGTWCYVVRAFRGYPAVFSEATEPCCVDIKQPPTPTLTLTFTNTPSITPTFTKTLSPSITPTNAITPTPTPTISPTGTSTEEGKDIIQSVKVGPNISDGHRPIRFLFKLSKTVKVDLMIFALSGELVFTNEVQGSQGVNTLEWEAENRAKQSVASGVYVFLLKTTDGTTQEIRTGKIAIIR